MDPSPSAAQAAETVPAKRIETHRSTATILLAAVAVISAWVLLELWGLGAVPFHTKGEPREALVVWEMTHGGGWILPKRNGTELPSKPPLFHWLGALTSIVRGVTDEWSIRFPSALLSLIGVVGVLAAGTALWGPLAGVVAALSLMTTFEWARAATNARVDMTLTVGMEAAFLGFLFFQRTRRPAFLAVMYAGIALAALGKGPVGIVLPGAVALATILATGDFRLVREMRLLSGALFVAVVAGGWYALASQIGGADFIQKQVLNENVFRFIGGSRFSGGHRHTNFDLFGLLLLGLLPWLLFLPHTLLSLWTRRREISFRDGQLYCLVWITVVFGFYAAVASKRSVYLLALYPAVALLVGWWFQQAVAHDNWQSGMLRRIGAVMAFVFAALGVVVLLQTCGLPTLDGVAAWLSPRDRANVLSVSQAIAATPRLILACLIAACVAMLGFSAAAGRGYPGVVFGSLVAASGAVIIIVRLVVLPGIAQQETLREFMGEARAAVGPADTPFFYRTFDYGAVFYWGGHIPTHDGEFPSGAPRFLLMSKSEWERLRAQAVNEYEQVRLPSEPRRLVLVRRTGT